MSTGGGITEEGDRDSPVPGVRAMDHTADVGIEVQAPDLSELFRRAALGALWMALEGLPRGTAERRAFETEAEDLPGLMRAWLREVLYWQEVEGFGASEVEIRKVDGRRLAATVLGGRLSEAPVREIKGVTWHGLSVEEKADGWHARVIFDV